MSLTIRRSGPRAVFGTNDLVVRDAALDHEMNLADVVDVSERVDVKSDEIGELAALDRPLPVGTAQGSGRVDEQECPQQRNDGHCPWRAGNLSGGNIPKNAW